MPDLDSLRQEAEAAIAAAQTSAEVEELRVRFLGRRSELTQTLRSIGELPPEERGPVGKAANQAREALEQQIEGRLRELGDAELERRLAGDRIDVTLPGDPPGPIGALHLLTQTRRDIEDFFVGIGFEVEHGPEVEWDYYNFTSLNHPPAHPARMLQDTFYFSDDVLLRTHTSPMQTRMMEVREPPPGHLQAAPPARDADRAPRALRRRPARDKEARAQHSKRDRAGSAARRWRSAGRGWRRTGPG